MKARIFGGIHLLYGKKGVQHTHYQNGRTHIERPLHRCRNNALGRRIGNADPCEKNREKMTLKEYLEQSKDIQSNKVRIKLLDEGLKEHKCECCGLTTWLNQPIPLELHHKDGNRYNNVLENFELLCPNCHAFTDSYRGKNVNK